MPKARLGGDGLYFAILRLHTGSQLYAGPSLFEAAAAFAPGSCNGLGATRSEALKNAETNRKQMLAGLGLPASTLPVGKSPLGMSPLSTSFLPPAGGDLETQTNYRYC